jgi:WD40 repeat protein/tRNA A-37 threonylcarbamoyl transferase component Bud32
MNVHGGALIGRQFGEYRLMRFEGRGSFGDVYLGEHISDTSRVAVKVLRVQLTNIKELREFIMEARTVRFAHPNIIKLLDFNVDKDGTPYLVMAYAPKGTLRSRHRRGERLPVEVIVAYVKQMASALQYAHTNWVIHRDVKPENVLLGENDEILLSDFGIATVVHSTHSAGTLDRTGTAYYMAPEHIQGTAYPASDQYALGVMVYEWLCGEWPFNGDVTAIWWQHINVAPPSLCKKVPELSSEVEDVVMRALAKDRHERFASVQEFADALEEAARPKPPPGTTLFVYSGHSDEIRSVAWSPDGRFIASGSLDMLVQVWQPIWQDALIERVDTIVNYRGHHKSVNALAWSPDGCCIASASLDGSVQIWLAEIGDFVRSYNLHTDWVSAVAWSPDGRYLASGSLDDTVHIWEAATGEQVYVYQGHTDGIRALAWSLDGLSIASGSWDETVHVWEAATGVVAAIYKGHSKTVNAVAWSPLGQSIASASVDGTVQVWDASSGEPVFTYRGHSDSVNTIAWSPDGRRIASGGRDNSVQIWSASTGNPLYTYSDLEGWLMSIVWSPGGKHIASGSADNTVRVWRAI